MRSKRNPVSSVAKPYKPYLRDTYRKCQRHIKRPHSLISTKASPKQLSTYQRLPVGERLETDLITEVVVKRIEINQAQHRIFRPLVFAMLVTLSLTLHSDPKALYAEEPATNSSDSAFEQAVRPYLNRYCLECHGPEKQKAGLRLDQLDSDMIHGSDADTWQEVLDLTNVSEMPPDGRRATVRAGTPRDGCGIDPFAASRDGSESIHRRQECATSNDCLRVQ